MTMMTIQSQVGTGILSLGACRLYDEPTGIFNLRGLRRERGKVFGELGSALSTRRESWRSPRRPLGVVAEPMGSGEATFQRLSTRCGG
jgi:hypothetical protein